MLTITVNLQQMTTKETSFQFHRWRTRTGPNANHTFRELELDENLIFKVLRIRTEPKSYHQITETEHARTRNLSSFPSLLFNFWRTQLLAPCILNTELIRWSRQGRSHRPHVLFSAGCRLKFEVSLLRIIRAVSNTDEKWKVLPVAIEVWQKKNYWQ